MPDQPRDPRELDPSLFMNERDLGLIADFKQLRAYNASIIDEFDDSLGSATLLLDPVAMLVKPNDPHARLLRRTMLRDLYIPHDSVPLAGFDGAWTSYDDCRERIFQIQRADKIPVYAKVRYVNDEVSFIHLLSTQRAKSEIRQLNYSINEKNIDMRMALAFNMKVEDIAELTCTLESFTHEVKMNLMNEYDVEHAAKMTSAVDTKKLTKLRKNLVKRTIPFRRDMNGDAVNDVAGEYQEFLQKSVSSDAVERLTKIYIINQERQKRLEQLDYRLRHRRTAKDVIRFAQASLVTAFGAAVGYSASAVLEGMSGEAQNPVVAITVGALVALHKLSEPTSDYLKRREFVSTFGTLQADATITTQLTQETMNARLLIARIHEL